MRQIAISMHDRFHAEIHHFCALANEGQSVLGFRHVFVPPDQQEPFAKQQLRAEEACERAFLLSFCC
jgi:hypothetical protein